VALESRGRGSLPWTGCRRSHTSFVEADAPVHAIMAHTRWYARRSSRAPRFRVGSTANSVQPSGGRLEEKRPNSLHNGEARASLQGVPWAARKITRQTVWKSLSSV